MGGISTIQTVPGEVLRAFMEKYDLTADDLGEHLGQSRPTVYRWLKNGAPPVIDLALEALGRRFDEAEDDAARRGAR